MQRPVRCLDASMIGAPVAALGSACPAFGGAKSSNFDSCEDDGLNNKNEVTGVVDFGLELIKLKWRFVNEPLVHQRPSRRYSEEYTGSLPSNHTLNHEFINNSRHRKDFLNRHEVACSP